MTLFLHQKNIYMALFSFSFLFTKKNCTVLLSFFTHKTKMHIYLFFLAKIEGEKNSLTVKRRKKKGFDRILIKYIFLPNFDQKNSIVLFF
jgi:hypothetical protein